MVIPESDADMAARPRKKDEELPQMTATSYPGPGMEIRYGEFNYDEDD